MTRFSVLISLAMLLGGCGSSNHLHEYDFADRSAAVLAAIPPRPVVFTDFPYEAYVDPHDPIGSVFRAGTAIAKQREARAAQARMDSALMQIDLVERIAAQTLLQSTHMLGYRPVSDPDEADYLLDLRVQNYGLVASSWDATVHLEVEADVLLIDRRSRRVIWKKRLREAEPLSNLPVGLGTSVGNVFTARALSRLSVEDLTQALASLADFTTDRLIVALRDDFYESREE